jgi:hypothetical protein
VVLVSLIGLAGGCETPFKPVDKKPVPKTQQQVPAGTNPYQTGANPYQMGTPGYQTGMSNTQSGMMGYPPRSTMGGVQPAGGMQQGVVPSVQPPGSQAPSNFGSTSFSSPINQTGAFNADCSH